MTEGRRVDRGIFYPNGPAMHPPRFNGYKMPFFFGKERKRCWKIARSIRCSYKRETAGINIFARSVRRFISPLRIHEGLGLGWVGLHPYGNPTRDALEDAVAKLEEGVRAFAASSGMAAVQLVFSLFEKGAHFIHRGTFTEATTVYSKYSGKSTTSSSRIGTAMTNRKSKNFIKPNTKAVFIESPTNPLMKTFDLKKISEITKEHGILHIVDNTLYTPYIKSRLPSVPTSSCTVRRNIWPDITTFSTALVVTNDETLAEELAFCTIGSVRFCPRMIVGVCCAA